MLTTAKAASLLAAARQLLAREDPKAALEARRSAEQALAVYQEKGDEDGELEAMQEVIMADLAGKQPLEAVRMAKDKLFLFQNAGNKKGEAAMLLALACAQLATKEPGPALDSAKKAVVAFQKLGDAKGEFRALAKAMVNIYILSGEKKEALNVANQALALAKRLGEPAKADAAFAVMQARIAGDAKDSVTAAHEALTLYKKTGDVKGQAATYSAMAEVYLSKDPASAASNAKEAMALYQDLNNSKATASALQLVVKAYIQSGEPAEALKAAQEQLRVFKQKGDLKGEASTYVPLFIAHRSQEDQDAGANEALEMAGDALELLRQLGDRSGEASMWVLVAETHVAYGMDQVALHEAQEALMIYRDLKDRKGQDSANIVITEVYIRQGKPALAPLHGEGLELLSKIANAIDERDGPAYQAATERLMSIGGFGLLTDTEQAAALSPVISRDPDGCTEFINANAPDGQEVDEAGGRKTGPQGIQTVVKAGTYFGFRFGGIAYGPRYRCIDFGSKFVGLKNVKDNDMIGLSVLQLQDHSDDWEVSLKLHPAILDCALQSTSCAGEYMVPQGKDDKKGKK